MSNHKTTSNRQKALVITKMYLSLKDIAIIHDCGASKAGYYKSQFLKWCEENDIKLCNGDIPADLYTLSIELPVNRILNYAKKGY